MDREFIDECRVMLAVAEACWKGSYSWHVFDWMAYRLRVKYPLIRNSDRLIALDQTTT
jgi:hypothetical protein